MVSVDADEAGDSAPVREPAWYREVPNQPGTVIFGAGAATVPGRFAADQAREDARDAALRQLRGRLRTLVERALARYPQGAVPYETPRAFASVCIDEPFTRRRHDEITQLEQAIRDIDRMERTHPGSGLVTAWHLVAVDMREVMTRIDDVQREWRKSSRSDASLPMHELFVAMRLEQGLAWGHAPMIPSGSAADSPSGPPDWFVRLPDTDDGRVHGVGRAIATEPVDSLTLTNRARRAARRHLRDAVQLTLELALNDRLVQIGDERSEPDRHRYTKSVAQLVAVRVASQATLVDEQHQLDADATGAAWALIGCEPGAVAETLLEVLQPDGGDSDSGLALPPVEDWQAWWCDTWQRLWLTTNRGD